MTDKIWIYDDNRGKCRKVDRSRCDRQNAWNMSKIENLEVEISHLRSQLVTPTGD